MQRLARLREHPVHVIVLGREHFPLPVLAADPADIPGALENNRGLVVIRGLPFRKYDDDDVARIFWDTWQHSQHMALATHGIDTGSDAA